MAILFSVLALAAPTWPTSSEARQWKPDSAWMRSAQCIHRHESVNWHLDHVNWQGKRSPYAGGMQFLDDTWRRAGGTGNAAQWSPREQLYRAWRIWKLGGGSWREWGTARACGLR